MPQTLEISVDIFSIESGVLLKREQDCRNSTERYLRVHLTQTTILSHTSNTIAPFSGSKPHLLLPSPPSTHQPQVVADVYCFQSFTTLRAVPMASKSSWCSHFWLLLSLLIIFASNFSLADALTQSLCSSQNTGADSQPGQCWSGIC